MTGRTLSRVRASKPDQNLRHFASQAQVESGSIRRAVAIAVALALATFP